MTGNQEGIGNYDSRSLANGGHNYNGQDGIAITTLANPDLKWEKSDQTNIGLDLSLFNDRVTVGMDYFIKNTKDLLYDRPLHTTTGFSSITQNIGSMRNTGFEFNVESHNIMNDRFSWDTQFNISTIKNKLTSLIDEKPIPVATMSFRWDNPSDPSTCIKWMVSIKIIKRFLKNFMPRGFVPVTSSTQTRTMMVI